MNRKLPVCVYLVCGVMINLAGQSDGSRETARDDKWLAEIHDRGTRLIASHPDSAILLAGKILDSPDINNKLIWKAKALRMRGNALYITGNMKAALDSYTQALTISEEIDYTSGQVQALGNLGNVYAQLGEFESAHYHYSEILKLNVSTEEPGLVARTYSSLGKLFSDQGRFIEAIQYYKQGLILSEERKLVPETGLALNDLGTANMAMGNFVGAFESFSAGLEHAIENDDNELIVINYNNLGNLYMQLQDFAKARWYYNEAVRNYTGPPHSWALLSAYQNLGFVLAELGLPEETLSHFRHGLDIATSHDNTELKIAFHNQIGSTLVSLGDFETAHAHFETSIQFCKEIKSDRLLAETHEGFGKLYWAQKLYNTALENFLIAYEMYESLGLMRFKVELIVSIGTMYLQKSDTKQASYWCKKCLSFAEKTSNTIMRRAAAECLYNIYKRTGDTKNALQYHEYEQQLSDSLQSERLQKQLRDMEIKRQIQVDSIRREEEKLSLALSHQQEISLQQSRQNRLILSGVVLLLIAAGLGIRLRIVRKSRAAIQKERARSDSLLLNILPGEVVEELKVSGQSNARTIHNVTILFTDFQGFTRISEAMDAQELVSEIHICFSEFDKIITEFAIEKIKTIGDAYMAAGGLNSSTDSSVKNVVCAALAMQEYIQSRSLILTQQNKPHFEMRVGIHTGSVIAGIVGSKKFQYDIWGDAVNIASRMEASGEIRKVNISDSTYHLIKDDPAFQFEERGKIHAKNKGEMNMYFVMYKQ